MFKNKLLAILASIMTLSVSAQDCEVHLMVAPMSQIAEVRPVFHIWTFCRRICRRGAWSSNAKCGKCHTHTLHW